VIEVTRNMMMKGNRPSIGTTRRLNASDRVPKISPSSQISTDGTTRRSAIVRGSRRSC